MTAILRRPVSGRSVWKAADLRADQTWVQHLDAEDLAELEGAVVAVRARGLAPFAFTRADFPAPRFARRIARVHAELEHGRGCVLLKGLRPERCDDAGLMCLYWGIGVWLGTPVSQNSRGELIARVTDRGGDYRDDNVRGYTTRAALRPHCDAADVVALLCEQTGSAGGESTISSSMAIYNEILAERPHYLEPLHAGFHFDLRGEGATGAPDEVTRNRVPVFSYHAGRLSCRYNQRTIEDGCAKAGMPLSGLALEAVRYVGELANRDDLRHDMVFERGDIQILSNYLVLHGRAAFADAPADGRKRSLLRLWVNVPDGRPLAPAFADRMNTGPRGGVAVAGRDY